ncbi:hypothetical protein R3P38DRAFT_3191536 [Favolaschia claudopus]|uniref:Cytochrome P450 n=1 Tax=Favolaschia claudopus TaxID=2862362 RepID=A0AAW0BL61_9AGAR
MSVLDKPQFAGVLSALRPPTVSLSFEDDDSSDDEAPAQDEIQDDIEGEEKSSEFEIAIYQFTAKCLSPLAQFPGPTIGKITQLWTFWKTLQGYKYLDHKSLHDRYGAYVRIGPNGISVIDAPAVRKILGRDYESGRHPSTPPSIVCLSGDAHTAKRRLWDHAMTPASIKDYEPLVAARARELVSCLRLRDPQIGIDLVAWVDLFTGFKMMENGRDADGLGKRI